MVTFGQYRELDTVLADILAHYRPAPEGASQISACVISLPIPEWHQYAWLEGAATASIAAGNSDDVTLFTCPADERIWLDNVTVDRASGDNTWAALRFEQGAGYGDGGAVINLVWLATANANIWWPHPPQVITASGGPGPLLMEPGATVQLKPSGAGAGASVANYRILMRRMKLVRARAP